MPTKKAKPMGAGDLLDLASGETVEGTAVAVQAETVEEAEPLPSTDLVIAEPARGSVVILDREKFSTFYERLRAETATFVPDVTTDKGRKAIAAEAFKVTKVKTSLDKQAKALTEEARAIVNAVNAGRSEITKQLEALRDEVRQPLTDWEAAEEDRKEANRATIRSIQRDAVILESDTSGTVSDRGRAIFLMAFPAPQWTDEEAAFAESARKVAVDVLAEARTRLKKSEAEAAELAELRAKQAARDEEDRLAAIAKEEKEAAEQAERDAKEKAERAEAEEKERAEREAARLQKIADDAAQAARDQAEKAAQEQRDRVQKEHDDAIAAEKDRADAAEKAAKEAADRVEADRLKAKQAADEQAAADAKRAKDRAHVAAVMGEAKLAIMGCGCDEETARKIVLAIKGEVVPHVSIAF